MGLSQSRGETDQRARHLLQDCLQKGKGESRRYVEERFSIDVYERMGQSSRSFDIKKACPQQG